MNAEQRLKELAAAARSETAPRVDVAHDVIRTLRGMQGRGVLISPKPMMWVAAFSSAAAVVIAAFALVAWYAGGEPLTELSQAISWVTQ
jgi:hypothetical protein